MRQSPQSPAESLDPIAEAHSRRLVDLIRREAAERGGLLPFDRYMELALYAPGLGYYVAGARKFGATGDFVTAPEISPLFGRCIAGQCAEVFEALGGGDVLELGAGSGALAADLLAGLLESEQLPGRYLILEPSPELRERQRRLLAARVPELLDRISWLERLPEAFTGLVLANEVADAMPVHRFSVRDDGTAGEVMVRPAGDGWEELVANPASRGLVDAVRALQEAGLAAEPGYSSEINLRLRPWIEALACAMQRGLVLLIDYGYSRAEYYHAERGAGTLVCHYRHRAHGDPYRHIGLQDITAHVDFSALAEAGSRSGLELAGYTTQAHFLIACGLDALMAEAVTAEGGVDLLPGAKQLVLPSAMGERFRVLAFTKGITEEWRGFSLRDLRGRL